MRRARARLPLVPTSAPTETAPPERVKVLDWFRVDVSARVLRVLVLSITIMVAGAFGAASFVRTGSAARLMSQGGFPSRAIAVSAEGRPLTPMSSTEATYGGLGLLVVLIGVGIGVFGLYRILSEDDYLALRQDGVLLVEGRVSRFVAWSDIDEVHHDPEADALVVTVRDQGEWRIAGRFNDADGAELAKRVASVRRRALFGLV